jgi:hypothetical protein
MPIFYRGAGVGTYWHVHDPANPRNPTGFTAKASGMLPDRFKLINHIRTAATNSPYVSLTRSYGVAEHYALFSGKAAPTSVNPAYVYEITVPSSLPPGLHLLDPVQEVAGQLPQPVAASSYQHDGSPNFLLGVIDPTGMASFLSALCPQPPPGGGTPRPPHLSEDLEVLLRALRDAEILAIGTIPSSFITNRFDVS